MLAERTKLSVDGVEFLLMKALALHLIEGSIDQVGVAWWDRRRRVLLVGFSVVRLCRGPRTLIVLVNIRPGDQ